jgi:uncharacterized membrane protein
MITVDTLKVLIIIAGLLHLCITSAGFTMTFVLKWRSNLAPLCALTRHIVWSHAAFVLLTIIAFGVVSIACAPLLVSGEPLARAVCGFIAAFWGLRLLVGFFLFDARPWLTNIWLKLGYHGLTAVFTFFVLCYGMGALR